MTLPDLVTGRGPAPGPPAGGRRRAVQTSGARTGTYGKGYLDTLRAGGRRDLLGASVLIAHLDAADCCALLAAEQTTSAVAPFDRRLAAAADDRVLRVLGR